MNKIFFSQQLLDALIDEGRIKLDRNILTLLVKDQHSFVLEPAYRITKTADNNTDPNGLVGQIKSEAELRAGNAEIYMDSIMLGNTAYIAEPGFLGAEKDVMDKLSDTDLLARFLLENLL